MVWTVIGIIATVLITPAFVPQLVRMWRTRSVRDVSLLTLVQLLVGVALITAYVIHLGDPILIVSNVIGLTVLVLTVASHLVIGRRGVLNQDHTRALPGRG